MGREIRKTDEGYTIHETVSEEEGAVSPTFPTKDELGRWLTTQGFSEKAIRGFLKAEHSPSMMYANGRLYKAIECCELYPEEVKDE